MSLSFNPSFSEWRNKFANDFTIIANWDLTVSYKIDELTFEKNDTEDYTEGKNLIYKALIDGTTGFLPSENPGQWQDVNDEFKNSVITSFDYDMAEICAVFNFNSSAFSDLTTNKSYFYLLVSHYIVINNYAGGLESGSSLGSQTSQSVDKLAESFEVPSIAKNNIAVADLGKTVYGNKYLMGIYNSPARQRKRIILSNTNRC